MNTWALTTVARFKSFVGITSNAYDTKIGIIIDVATDLIEKYCDRRFIETTYTDQYYDGNGSTQLLLRQYPISTRATFQLDERNSDMNDASFSSVDTSLYHLDYTNGMIELVGYKFREVPKKYKVTYTAGYAFDNTTPGATLESLGIGDLEYACWVICNNIYKHAASPTGISSESIGNYSVSYGGQGWLLKDPELKLILDKYKRPHYM
jgi:hypothetical protein